jgi:hypothetical protein
MAELPLLRQSAFLAVFAATAFFEKYAFFDDSVVTSSSIADREWDSLLVLGIWDSEPREDRRAHGFDLKALGHCGPFGPQIQR